MSDLLLNMPFQYEPLRKNRFICSFDHKFGISEWTAKSAARPTIETNETEIHFLNTSTWVGGRTVFASFQIVLRDPIGPSMSQATMEMYRLMYEASTGRMGYAAGYQQNIYIKMLDPTGVVVQKWVYWNSMITSANFGELSMDDDGIAEITLTIRPQYAELLF